MANPENRNKMEGHPMHAIVGKIRRFKPRQLLRNLCDLAKDEYGLRNTRARMDEICDKYNLLLDMVVDANILPKNEIYSRYYPLWADYLFHKVVNSKIPLPHDFDEEIAFLKERGQILAFPYEQLKHAAPVQADFDDARAMPFVLHNNRRLYFPKEWKVHRAVAKYVEYVEVENILGGGYSRKAPHQYQTDGFCVHAGDVVVDVGSAEALFSLDVIDLVRRVYIIESEPQWQEPLRATFAPFQEKAVIIHKAAASVDSDHQVRISSILEKEPPAGLFVKMDVEGGEESVLEDLLPRLPENIDVRIACCVYHRHDDAERIYTLFAKYGFQVEFSDGVMLYINDPEQQFPYFRRGLIRALRPAGRQDKNTPNPREQG
jgi:hypothetical protein